MSYFTKQDIEYLRSGINEILIDISQDRTGFSIILVLSDDRQMTCPETMSLGEALGYSIELGNLIGLPDECMRVNKAAIDQNRLNDLDAMKAGKAIKEGVINLY